MIGTSQFEILLKILEDTWKSFKDLGNPKKPEDLM